MYISKEIGMIYCVYLFFRYVPISIAPKHLGYILLGMMTLILIQLFILERILYDVPYTYFGFFENHASLAVFLAIALPIIYQSLSKNGMWIKIIVSLTLFGITIYYSRTAFIAVFLSAILYFLLAKKLGNIGM